MAAVRDRRLPQLSLTLHKPPILIIAPSPTVAAADDNRHHDLERIAVIGNGNGGTVYKVRHRPNNSVYALKILNSNHNGRRELEIMKRFGESEHVVRMVSSFVTSSGDLGILMEMMDAGTLDSVLRKHERLSEPAIAEIARQVLHGLACIHSQKIAHRDIKPSNLLINSRGQIKIADFGVSKIMHRSLNTCVSYVGTCAYMSPERFDPDAHGGEYDAYAADVWSLGLTLMELHLGHFPLLPAGQRPDWSALLWAICFGDKPPVPDSASDEFKDFIECCLNREPGKRSSVLELIRHPFVTGRDLAQAGQAWMELVA